MEQNGRITRWNVVSKVMAGACGLALAASMTATPALALTNADDANIPATTSTTTDDYIKGAATRAAMPSIEVLGLASVEESGQFIDTSEYFKWAQPKFMLAATAYNTVPSPFLANLGTGTGTEANPAAVFNASRAGGGAGPNGSLQAVGGSDATDQAVWALQPDVVVGTGGGVTYPAYATGVAYSFSDYTGLADTMDNIAAAADAADAADDSRTLRYGEQSASDIATDYRQYIFGTMGAVQQAINNGTVAKRTVALVQDYYYDEDSDTYYYDLMTTAEAGGDGTAATNRYLETTSNSGLTGIGLANNYANTQEIVTADQLSDNVDLIMVGGQQSAANYADIMGGLAEDGLLGSTYFVENNGSAGAMYGVVMNSVENAQNVGRILGCLYPEVVNQQNWMAYYYETFYHIDSADLATVMSSALDGVRCWTADAATVQSAVQWTVTGTGYASGASQASVDAAITAGYTYYQSLQA